MSEKTYSPKLSSAVAGSEAERLTETHDALLIESVLMPGEAGRGRKICPYLIFPCIHNALRPLVAAVGVFRVIKRINDVIPRSLIDDP